MRARLVSILALLLVVMIAAVSVPFALRFAWDDEQAMFLDRRQDTGRFASIAAQNVDDTDALALRDQISRYHQVYGVAAGVVNSHMTVEYGAGDLDLDSPAVTRALQSALAGHDSEQPSVLSLAEAPELAVAMPITRGDDIVGAVLTVSPTTRLRDALMSRLRQFVGAELAAVLVFVLVALRLGSWVLHPVSRLDEAIERINAGDLDTRAPAERGPAEMRRLAASFNRMVEEAQRAMASQQAFVANAAHQLRNPLTVLTLRLEMLRLGGPEARECELDDILDESARLDMILNQLLELATVQGGPAVQPHLVDVVRVVRGRVATWEEGAKRRGTGFELDSPPTAPAFVDTALVSSIIDAVFDNAVKFSPPGATVAVRVRETGAEVWVETEDAGPGVADAELEKLGERFWRSAATGHVPGSGLGLAIALELAAAVGGRLVFEHAEPSGLRVRLCLPARKKPATDETAEESR